MLPEKIRNRLFDDVSTRTMRYVHAVPVEEADGLVARVYEQVIDDFFTNGSITCQSSVPPLMAAMWCRGRETIREKVRWAIFTVDPETRWTGPPPFEEEEMPAALGSVFTFGRRRASPPGVTRCGRLRARPFDTSRPAPHMIEARTPAP